MGTGSAGTKAMDAPTDLTSWPHLCNKSLSLMAYVTSSPKARIYINAVLENFVHMSLLLSILQPEGREQ